MSNRHWSVYKRPDVPPANMDKDGVEFALHDARPILEVTHVVDGIRWACDGFRFHGEVWERDCICDFDHDNLPDVDWMVHRRIKQNHYETYSSKLLREFAVTDLKSGEHKTKIGDIRLGAKYLVDAIDFVDPDGTGTISFTVDDENKPILIKIVDYKIMVKFAILMPFRIP